MLACHSKNNNIKIFLVNLFIFHLCLPAVRQVRGREWGNRPVDRPSVFAEAAAAVVVGPWDQLHPEPLQPVVAAFVGAGDVESAAEFGEPVPG